MKVGKNIVTENCVAVWLKNTGAAGKRATIKTNSNSVFR
jgi:hypothetical protein